MAAMLRAGTAPRPAEHEAEQDVEQMNVDGAGIRKPGDAEQPGHEPGHVPRRSPTDLGTRSPAAPTSHHQHGNTRAEPIGSSAEHQLRMEAQASVPFLTMGPSARAAGLRSAATRGPQPDGVVDPARGGGARPATEEGARHAGPVAAAVATGDGAAEGLRRRSPADDGAASVPRSIEPVEPCECLLTRLRTCLQACARLGDRSHCSTETLRRCRRWPHSRPMASRSDRRSHPAARRLSAGRSR